MSKNNFQTRRSFIKKSLSGAAVASFIPHFLRGETKNEKKEDGNFIYRELGKTGIKLPVVSMGVMNSENPNLVRAALESGIKLLDTAYFYQRGKNEKMIGNVIKDFPRDSYVIATKVPGLPRDRETGLFTKETDPERFEQMFEESLKRLGLDYVDILYLHGVKKREATLFEPLMTTMEKLKKQGKTRFIGVTTHSNEAEVIQAVIDSKIYDVVLTAYNFRQENRNEIKKAIARAANAGIGVVAMKTQAGVYWDEEKIHKINMKAALKWVLQDTNVHTAIPGFTTFDQMNLDLSVMKDLTMTLEEKRDLMEGESKNYAGFYCQQCEKCLPQCKKGLDIPTLMRSYMYAFGYRNIPLAKDTYNSLEINDILCSECDKCLVNCTMNFNIKNKILSISKINNIPDEFIV